MERPTSDTGGAISPGAEEAIRIAFMQAQAAQTAAEDDEDDEALYAAPGTHGKRVASVLWTIQTCHLVFTAGAGVASIFALDFVLKPLIMAYFVTFLMAPIIDVMEKRPYQLWGPCGKMPKNNPSDAEVAYQAKLLCQNNFEHQKRVALVGKIMKHGKYDVPNHDFLMMEGLNCVLLGKLPHAIACLITLAVFFGTAAMLALAMLWEIERFAVAEATKSGEDYESMADKIFSAGNWFVDQLAENEIYILKDEYCVPFTDDIAIRQEEDNYNNYVLNYYIYGFVKAESEVGETIAHGENSDTECDKLDVFRREAGTAWVDVIAYFNYIMVIVNDIILIMLLAVFIMLERPEGSTFGMSSRGAIQLEDMCKLYIGLKTLLSAGTGAVCGVLLWLCGTKLSFVWGVATFVLNFVPQIGNIVSCLLPLPLIVLDEDMGFFQAFGAVMLPVLVQLYTSNFLEPEIFGTALNLTPLSVLLALVFFTYAWGIPGAILSVPLLGTFKIMLHNSEHPLSETILRVIRADADIDIEKDLDLDEWLDRMEMEQHRIDKVFHVDLEHGDGATLAATDHRTEEHLIGFSGAIARKKVAHTNETQVGNVHGGYADRSKNPALQADLASHSLHHSNDHVSQRERKAVLYIQSLQRGRAARDAMRVKRAQDALYKQLETMGLQQFHAPLIDNGCKDIDMLPDVAESVLKQIGMSDEDVAKLQLQTGGATA
eukprot:SAG22_NODE_90_length_21067_cov_8.490843_1_plen_714_part_00